MRKNATLCLIIALLASILVGCRIDTPDLKGKDGEMLSRTGKAASQASAILPSIPASVPTETTVESADKTAEIPQNSCFEIYFLDVGEGDSAVIICDGHAMIIDGGGSDSSSFVYSFLKSHGIDHLDVMVNTHPDADHVGGLSGALNYAKTDVVLCPVTSHDTKTFSSFLKYVQQQNLSITLPDVGDTFSLGSARTTVLSSGREKTESGNDSIVIRMEYGDTSFLFTGDAEEEQENALTADYGKGIKSTLLKVGHHGSSTSTTSRFLNAVCPEYSVISVGGRNEYGHPAVDVLSNLKSAGTALFRTDIQGMIHCISDGQTLKFEVEKNADLDTFSYDGGYNNALERAEMLAAAEAAEAERSSTGGEAAGVDYIMTTE